MTRRARRVGAATVPAAGGIALLGATLALASPFSRPVLKAPGNGNHVAPGVITLIVKDPGVPKRVRPVYATISPRRTLDRYGHLKMYKGCGSRCDFVALKPWRRHPGYWIYRTPYNFPGYWAVTPGRYYWQAQHVAPLCHARGCEVASRIQTFHVG